MATQQEAPKVQAYSISLKDDLHPHDLDEIVALVEKEEGTVVEKSGLAGTLTVTFKQGATPSVLNDSGKNYTVEKNEEVQAKYYGGNIYTGGGPVIFQGCGSYRPYGCY